MNAIRSPQSYRPAPGQRPGGVLRQRRRVARRVNPHRTLAFEVGSQLLVSVGVAIAACVGLAQLIPMAVAQQAQLEEINQEVSKLESRVDRLQNDFNYRFDPQQAQRIMQEQSNRVAPGQVRVIWKEASPHRADVSPPPAPIAE